LLLESDETAELHVTEGTVCLFVTNFAIPW